jgi:hypothetical protein
MKRSFSRLLIPFVLCSILATAKRVPPKPVPPIIADGIRYSAEGDGKDSFVVATDETSGKTLWRVKVFHTRIEFWRGEEDNQWLFISDLKLAGNNLLVRDEKNRCYSISVNTRSVKRASCGQDWPMLARGAKCWDALLCVSCRARRAVSSKQSEHGTTCRFESLLGNSVYQCGPLTDCVNS